MDATNYKSLNQLYNYVSEIQEQQLLMKNLQKNSFILTQMLMMNMEAQLISAGLGNSYGSISPAQISSTMENMIPPNVTEEDRKNLQIIVKQIVEHNPNFDDNQFWNMYRQQDERLKGIINSGALIPYIPVQIKISLDKILREYSMLEITGSDGYQLLKKMSKKKF